MSSMANEDIKTMNPKDKFINPRAPPPMPSLSRLNTATSVLTKKRSTRSLSPKSEKTPWSPRMFFGLRSHPCVQEDKRGRSSSLSKASQDGMRSGSSILSVKQFELRSAQSLPHTRSNSPQSFKRLHSRSPSPLQQVTQEKTPYSPTGLFIPDEIAEEAEDDDNFASLLNRLSMSEKGIHTPLAPPPSGRKSPARVQTATKDTSKPLPQLPEESIVLSPPLRLRLVVSAADLPRSHFSVSTVATALSSPSDSHFSFNYSKDENLDDVEDLTADIGSGDEFTYSPTPESPTQGFSSYSLPGEYSSVQTLKMQSPIAHLTQTVSRTTFGAIPYSPTTGSDEESMSALELLMSEMGYLGDVIVGKS